MIAHALATYKNRRYGGNVDVEKVLLYALYHEAAEVITGDLASPIKYFNPGIRDAYKEIERMASEKLLDYLPADFQEDFRELLFPRRGELRMAHRQGGRPHQRLRQVPGGIRLWQPRVPHRAGEHPRLRLADEHARGRGFHAGIRAELHAAARRFELKGGDTHVPQAEGARLRSQHGTVSPQADRLHLGQCLRGGPRKGRHGHQAQRRALRGTEAGDDGHPVSGDGRSALRGLPSLHGRAHPSGHLPRL